MAGNTRLMQQSPEIERLTREQTARVAMEDMGPDDEWAPLPFTTAPPPRPGFEQRWVRIRLVDDYDVKNYLRQYQRGWRIRAADTLPGGYEALKRRLDAQFGDQGDVIGNQDCILMERTIALGNKVRAYYVRQNQRLHSQIDDFVGAAMPRTHGARGGMVDELSIQAKVGNGRVPPIAPD